MEAQENYTKWLKKRIKTIKAEYAERRAIVIDTPEKLQNVIAKGGKLCAFKEMLAYIETHQNNNIMEETNFKTEMEKQIRAAYVFLREKNNTIPSEVLDFMLTASLDRLETEVQNAEKLTTK